MNKVTLWLVTIFLVGAVAVAEAQQPTKDPTDRIFCRAICIRLIRARRPPDQRSSAFRQGLRELGYIEGKNIVIEYRYADGRSERLPALTEELVRLNVEAILSAAVLTVGIAKPRK